MSALVRPLPHLGLGLGLRAPHYAELFATWPDIGFFEVIADNFLHHSGLAWENLQRVAERYPVIPHGVSLNLGGCDPLDLDYLKGMRRLVADLNAPWWSDHLCWSASGGAHHHDLLPLPQNLETAQYIAQRIREAQTVVGRPLAVENLSAYAQLRDTTLSEGAYLRTVCETADCYLLLDLNNIAVSAHNLGYDPQSTLAEIPWERVVQIHLAGPSEGPQGLLIDTHSTPVRTETWALYAQAIAHCPWASTLLEWDEHLPTQAETWREAQKALHYQRESL